MKISWRTQKPETKTNESQNQIYTYTTTKNTIKWNIASPNLEKIKNKNTGAGSNNLMVADFLCLCACGSISVW